MHYRKVDWSEWDEKLGKVHDSWIAVRAGITRQAVSYRRRIKGIPPSREGLPAATLALRQSIQRALKAKTPQPVREIHKLVVNDYGSVTVRTIHRHLREMVKTGLAAIIREPGTSALDWGYVLKGGRR